MRFAANARLVHAFRLSAGPLAFALSLTLPLDVCADRTLVIAVSPSVLAPVEALARAFESSHPDVRVRLAVDGSLDLRRTIAAIENSVTERYFIGTGPVHLVAPGGDELLRRLEQKYYVLPGTIRSYADEPLVLVVPESLVEAPGSFDEVAHRQDVRIAVGDPSATVLGQKTQALFASLDAWTAVQPRLLRATDSRAVLDHLLNGRADVAILFGPDAAGERERVRVVAESGPGLFSPIIHSMAMERYCPDRALCREFLEFVDTSEAQAAVTRLGYHTPHRSSSPTAR